MKASLLLAVALVASACVTGPVTAQQERPSEQKPAAPPQKAVTAEQETTVETVNADALILQDFKGRIDKYLALRKQAAKAAPPLKETKDPEKILLAQHSLAAQIRALRSAAQPGDIFTPEIRNKLRRLLSPEMKGEDGRDAREILMDQAPGSVPLKVNANYPEAAALPTVPANLLLNLPTLPEQLEYRIIGKHLILRDAEANIIVDYMPNAIR